MIIGIGADIVEAQRLAAALERHGDRLAERVLSAEELDAFRAHAGCPGFLARRFAAKEAAAKALGTGIGRHAGFRELVVTRQSHGAPGLVFRGAARETALARGVERAHVSISDDGGMAAAFVVLEGGGEVRG